MFVCGSQRVAVEHTMCVPARWSSGISAHQNVECGSAQWEIVPLLGAINCAWSLSLTCGILKHHFCCSSPKKRICIGLLIIKGGSQFLALSKNWHQMCNGIDDPSFPSVQCGVAAACHCGHQSAVRYEVSLPGILMRRELQLQPQPPPVSTGWMHFTQPH